MTIQEFANHIGVHYNTVRNMIRNGILSAFKTGCGVTSSYRIPKSEIERLCVVNLGKIVKKLSQKKD